jgi:hypothetical protein
MKPSFLSSLVPLALPSILLAGCTGTEPAPPAPTVTLQDTFDSDPFGPNAGALHSPYVPGASFQITLVTSTSADGWTATSSDPNVLSLTPAGAGQLNAHASAPGHVTITVRDSTGLVFASPGVDVVMPTVARLYAPGRMIAGQSDALAHETTINVETGQAATLLIRYFAGETEVRGQASPEAVVNGAVAVKVMSTGVAYDRDWLQVASEDFTVVQSNLGPTNVQLGLASTPLASVPVNILSSADVASVVLDEQPDTGTAAGRGLYVVARGVAANGEDVFGLSLTWTLDGQPLSSQGQGVAGPWDTIVYTYDPSSNDVLSGTFGSQTASVSVHSSHAQNQAALVESTIQAPTACSVATVGRRSSGALAVWGALGIGLLGARRRRRAA